MDGESGDDGRDEFRWVGEKSAKENDQDELDWIKQEVDSKDKSINQKEQFVVY